jgi:hypothetical protein
VLADAHVFLRFTPTTSVAPIDLMRFAIVARTISPWPS